MDSRERGGGGGGVIHAHLCVRIVHMSAEMEIKDEGRAYIYLLGYQRMMARYIRIESCKKTDDTKFSVKGFQDFYFFVAVFLFSLSSAGERSLRVKCFSSLRC